MARKSGWCSGWAVGVGAGKVERWFSRSTQLAGDIGPHPVVEGRGCGEGCRVLWGLCCCFYFRVG